MICYGSNIVLYYVTDRPTQLPNKDHQSIPLTVDREELEQSASCLS